MVAGGPHLDESLKMGATGLVFETWDRQRPHPSTPPRPPPPATCASSPALSRPQPLRSDDTVLRLAIAGPVDSGKAGAAQALHQLFKVKRIVDDGIRSKRNIAASIEKQDHFDCVGVLEP